jgi:bacteriocin biosynthesis cyclodehydratase domain-containing protein
MSTSDAIPLVGSIRLKDVFGVCVLSPDEVQFRTGSMSGISYVVSDPERRGLLGTVIDRLFLADATQSRPWNESETNLIQEVLPQLVESGLVEADGPQPSASDARSSLTPILDKNLAEARVAIVGHGVLGNAVRSLLAPAPWASIKIFESSSVARDIDATAQVTAMARGQAASKPRETDWAEAIGGFDWIVAAQDSFEPEELSALNRAALRVSVPWSLVCFDGYEGWVGPTFVPGQTPCFNCFQRRLFAGSAEPKHLFMDARVRVHRVPSPWLTGAETAPWVSLIASMFALELIAATQGRSFTLNEMLIVHRLDLTFQRESVLRLPRCPVCSPRSGAPVINVFSHLLSTRVRAQQD